MRIPNDTELQKMTDAQLRALAARVPKYPEDCDWVRLARELRYRRRRAAFIAARKRAKK